MRIFSFRFWEFEKKMIVFKSNEYRNYVKLKRLIVLILFNL